jgi:hypothetical protein
MLLYILALPQSAADLWQEMLTDQTTSFATNIVLRARPQLRQKLQTHGLFRLPSRSDCRLLGSEI